MGLTITPLPGHWQNERWLDGLTDGRHLRKRHIDLDHLKILTNLTKKKQNAKEDRI